MDQQRFDEKTGRILGLVWSIPAASRYLGLNDEQVKAFYDATPNGGELWDMFIDKRDSKGIPDEYYFRDFMIDVLAKTKYPVNL